MNGKSNSNLPLPKPDSSVVNRGNYRNQILT